jgi:hypothetical protein
MNVICYGFDGEWILLGYDPVSRLYHGVCCLHDNIDKTNTTLSTAGTVNKDYMIVKIKEDNGY